MDSDLKTLMTLARQRGSRYLKKSHGVKEFPAQMAELGVFLLVQSDELRTGFDKKSPLAELNEIQNKVDHFRQLLFDMKRNVIK